MTVHRIIRAFPMAALLLGGAYCVALASVFPSHRWLAWIGLIPLFVTVRLMTPFRAALWGAVWGAGLYLFFNQLTGQAMSHAILPAAALATIAAAYAGLGTVFTRRYGFSPLALALGWLAIELVTHPLGLTHCLVPGVAGDGPLTRLVSDIFGYAFVGFVVALVNALALSLALRLCFARRMGRRPNGCIELRYFLQDKNTSYLLSFLFRGPDQRAPPDQGLIFGETYANGLFLTR